MVHKLGTVETSEKLIQELYINLKHKVNEWAAVTHQTSQARMGYVGQHLVSVVTGYPGGRSGARGKDLILPDGEFAEIKTCYRIDQLGKCISCGAVVASIETSCSSCGSTELKRNDDSKWLISIRNDKELLSILDDKYYFLVLFDFLDLKKPDDIRASIWKVDTKAPGFAYCMIDYYLNIRSKSSSKAPFNLWPYQLKFDLMCPELIYQAIISSEDTVKTIIFPNRDLPQEHKVKTVKSYARASNLTSEKLELFASYLGIKLTKDLKKKELCEYLDKEIETKKLSNKVIANYLARAIYYKQIEEHITILEKKLKDQIIDINKINFPKL